MTAQDLIDEILKSVGVVAEADTPSTTRRNTVLALFNAMLDAWNAEGLLTPYKDTASYTLTIGDNDYTIGPSGADLTATRPLEISMAEIRDSSGQDSELIPLTWEEFERMYDQNITSERPVHYTYQKKPGNGVIKVGPKPDQAYALRLTTVNLFAQVSLATSIDSNPGYLEAFKYNLKERTCLHYEKPISPVDVVIGENALRSIRRKVVDTGDAPVEPGVMQGQRTRYDIDRGY